MKLKDISEDDIYGLVGNTLAGRGFDYYESGMVLDLKVRNGKIIAEVAGSSEPSYTVKIWCDDDGVDGNCTCPYSQGIDVCKHVAAALFEWVYDRADDMEDVAVEAETLREGLSRLSKEQLIALLIEAVEENEALYQKVRILTEPEASDAEKDWVRETKAHIRRICAAEPYIDWDEIGIGSQLEAALAPVENADAKDKLEVYLYALQQIQERLPDYELDDLYEVASLLLAELGRALANAEVSPDERRSQLGALLKIHLSGVGWTDSEVADALRQACASPEEVEALIAQLENDDRYANTELLAKLYLHAGRDDAYLGIRLQHLNSDLDYLEVAEFYLNRSERNKAIEIAERGLRELTHKTALYPFLEEQYRTVGERRKLQELLCSQFEAMPSLEHYQRLKQVYTDAGDWTDEIRRKLVAVVKRDTNYGTDLLLAQIYLLEGDDDAALSLVQAKISEQALAYIAEGVAPRRPEKATAIYKALVADYLSINSRERYRIAARYAAKMKAVYLNVLGEEEAWNNYIRGIRFENRRRPALIDEFKLL